MCLCVAEMRGDHVEKILSLVQVPWGSPAKLLHKTVTGKMPGGQNNTFLLAKTASH